MLLLSLRTAVRALLRQRGYTLLNVFGLAIGLATVLIILTLVSAELRWDGSLDPDGQLYRMNQELAFPGTEEQDIANTCSAFGPVMTERVPEILDFTRIWGVRTAEVQRDEREPFVLSQVYLADSTFFSLFNYELVAGTPENAFRDRNAGVLREDIAQTLFPNGDWIGRELQLGNDETTRVSAVYRVPDPGSFFKPEALLPMHDSQLDLMSWQNHSWTTFFKLAPNADPEAVMNSALEHMPEREDQDVVTPWLQPFNDIHLHSSNVTNQINFNPGDYRMVAGFSAIAILILVLAAINYINITTAASIPRSREVSLRKVMGASKRSLIVQGLGESLLLAFFAMLLAILFCELAEPLVSNLTARPFNIFTDNPSQLALLIGLPIVTGLAGGLYPAMLLSSFHPTKALKGSTHLTSRRGLLRRGLVTFQFALSTALIIVTVALYFELDQLRETGFGFSTKSVLVVENSHPEYVASMPLLADAIRKQPSIEVSGMSQNIPGVGNWEITVSPEGMDDPSITHAMAIDRATADVYGLNLIEGRWFDINEYPGDGIEVDQRTGASVVVNQRFVDMAGWDDAVGKTVRFWDMEHTVVGVVANFHQRNLYHPFHPMVIFHGPYMSRFVSALARPGQTEAAMTAIEAEWAKLTGDAPIEIHFADDLHIEHYRTENLAALFLRSFSVLAILIATVGLVGMTAISATQKIREISIRKVLGANVIQILSMLNREFVALVILANVIAWPIAWFLIRTWLDRFAFNLPFPYWVFPVCSLAIIAAAVLITSLQGSRFAHIHPARILRYE